MILQKKSSTIFQNPEEYLVNLTPFGAYTHEDSEIRIQQESHYFHVGDVLYFDIKNDKFAKALAINSMTSEVCGIVSEVPNDNEFIIITEGFIETDRYKFNELSTLYLSEVVPGTLMSARPTVVSKEVGIQLNNGIQVDIKNGYYLTNKPLEVTMVPYTKEELDDIILNIKGVT